MVLVAAKPSDKNSGTAIMPHLYCLIFKPLVIARSSDHGHWTIRIGGPMTIKFVLTALATVIVTVHIIRRHDATHVLINITPFFMVPLFQARRTVVKGGRNFVLRGVIIIAYEYHTDGPLLDTALIYARDRPGI